MASLYTATNLWFGNWDRFINLMVLVYILQVLHSPKATNMECAATCTCLAHLLQNQMLLVSKLLPFEGHGSGLFDRRPSVPHVATGFSDSMLSLLSGLRALASGNGSFVTASPASFWLGLKIGLEYD